MLADDDTAGPPPRPTDVVKVDAITRAAPAARVTLTTHPDGMVIAAGGGTVGVGRTEDEALADLRAKLAMGGDGKRG